MPLQRQKRKRAYGLGSLELRLAYDTLLKVKQDLKDISVTPDTSTENPDGLIMLAPQFEDALDSMLAMMGAGLDEPRVYWSLSQNHASSDLFA